jgi:hypothetical protein
MDFAPIDRVRRRFLGVALWVAAALAVVCPSAAWALPDGRVYEAVSPAETEGVAPGGGLPAISGNAVDFVTEPFGESVFGAESLYQANRTATGWKTKALSPRDVVEPTVLAEAPPLSINRELTQAIFVTEQPLVAEDQDEGAIDLYADSSAGALTWVSRGSQGGTAHDGAVFAGATGSGNYVAFNTSESLVPAATGLEASGYQTDDYLYLRNIPAGQTELVDLNDEGTLVNPEGAILGNGNWTDPGYLAADYFGTTTHAISEDGSKVFFESPPPAVYEFEPRSFSNHVVHLYMRKDNSVTVPLDNPSATVGAGARYMGASENGEYVFFVSDEGLAGNGYQDTELYVYDTATERLTSISSAPAGGPPVDGAVDGVMAISNDGSHVYYVAKGKLATNVNEMGQEATEGRFNLYVYDTLSGKNTFITELGPREIEPEEGSERAGLLVSYLDIERPAVPTPNGNVLVFLSLLDLTGQDPQGKVQVYRYEASSGSLICVSCDPTGAGGSTLDIGAGSLAGGTYAPPGKSAPMSADGEQIFFETENALVPEDQNSTAPPVKFQIGSEKYEYPLDYDIYEWDRGKIYLISSGKPGIVDLQGVTPNGNNVFFDTDVNLTEPGPNGYIRMYNARVGGGFPPEPPSSVTSCSSDESCRGPIVGTTPFATPGSSVVQGVNGNAPSPKGEAKRKRKSKAGSKSKSKRRLKAKAKPRSRLKDRPRRAQRSHASPSGERTGAARTRGKAVGVHTHRGGAGS